MTIIAHRCGTHAGFPENSVAAAARSREAGADAIELDIRFSRDGVPTVIHDADFGRLCGVERRVADCTAAEIARLRYREHPEAGPEPFSAFTSAGISPLLIHFKPGAAELERFLPVLEAAGYLERTVVGVRSVGALRAARGARRPVRTLAFMPDRGDCAAFLAAGADIIRLWDPWVDEAAVRAVHEAGRLVWVMTGAPSDGSVGLCTRERLAEYFDLGLDGILLNDVALGVSVARLAGAGPGAGC
jgi:glycerophosphoryl diester phosphodiesterase